MTGEQVFYDDVGVGGADALAHGHRRRNPAVLFQRRHLQRPPHSLRQTVGRTVEGYDDVLVHGPLQAALLARAIGDWIGGRGRLVSFSVQNRAIALPGEPLTFGGVVTGKRLTDDGAGLVDLDIAGRRDDTVLMPGTATVELPRRGTAS